MHARLTPPPSTAARTDALFLKGPVPWWWLIRAGALRKPALQVGIVLWLYAGMRRTHTVRLASRYLFPELGVSRFALRRALVLLETANLLRVQHRPGHPPLVTLVVEQWPPARRKRLA